MDFGGGRLSLTKGEDYVDGTPYSVAPEALIYDAGQGSFRYEYTGYEGLDIAVADGTAAQLTWDKENETVALSEE